MLQTEKLKLNKIELTDPADITVINPNWDTVETEITSLKTDKADVTYVNQKVADLVGSAPEALDTLKELSTALGNDPNFATTVSTQIGKKVDKVDGKGLSTNDYTTTEKNKLAGIATNANNYTHPSTHPASMIVEDATKRFVSDTEKTTWNGKLDKSGGTVTGEIICNRGGNGSGFVIANGTSRTIMYSSVTKGEHLFGGNNNSSLEPMDYIRIGQNKIIYKTDGQEYNIYHQGNKPTPEDIGASTSNHTHNYLSLSGGTVKGDLKISKSLATMTINSLSGTEASLIFDRGSGSASYKMSDISGVFKLQCNYNNSTNVDYYDTFTITHSSGDTWHKGSVTAPRFISNIATGTAPFTVASTTAVTNLNADLLDGLHSSSFLRGDASNSSNLQFGSESGLGVRFYSSGNYSICMSSSTDSTYGGRLSGETTSDYNMYFRMGAGTNRGFVFKNENNCVMGIDASGNVRAKGNMTIADNKVSMQYNSTTESLDFIFV